MEALMTDIPPMSEAAPAAADINVEPKAKKPPHRWKPGESGNPTGMRPGSRHKASLLAETLLDGEADRITRRCIYSALKGEPVALRLCLERLLPPVKSRPLRFKLPVLETVADAQAALAAVVAGMTSGALLADEAATLSSVINSFLKSFELSELEARLCALEQAGAEERPHFDA
jgi:hypothetical protein